jgi:hypothetical protein
MKADCTQNALKHGLKRKKASIKELVSQLTNEELLLTLQHPKSFLKFLEKEGCGVPHVTFWHEVEEFKRLSDAERESKGLMIYSE